MKEMGALQTLVLCIANCHVFGEFETFIHFPTWSCDEVCHLLDCAIALK
jgi:hypothetical protein